MPADNKTNYLAKLLTLLIKRSDGTIKVPIQDLMTDDVGQGFQVWFNQETKELVLSFVPAGSTIYKIEGGVTWLTNQSFPQPSLNVSKPLSQEDLVAKAWSESGATPTQAELSRPSPKNKVVTLTTESMADAELEKRKQKALREIENYQSPQPRSIRSSAGTMFLKP